MLKKIEQGEYLNNLIDAQSNHHNYILSDLELSYYKKVLQKAIVDGDAYEHFGSVIFINNILNAPELIYAEMCNEEEDLKFICQVLPKYPGIRLRPLHNYYFGLASILNIASLRRYIRGDAHLVNINISSIEAEKILEQLA